MMTAYAFVLLLCTAYLIGAFVEADQTSKHRHDIPAILLMLALTGITLDIIVRLVFK